MERLVAIALGVSAMSMFLSSAALWPHSQAGLQKARNGFLWGMFAFVAVGGATISFRKMEEHRATRSRASQTEFASQRREFGLPAKQISLPLPPPRSMPVYNRLDLRPQSGFAAAPIRHEQGERVYQANHRRD